MRGWLKLGTVWLRELLINIINDITPGLIKWKEIIAYSKLIITKNLCGVYNIVPGNYNEHDIKKKESWKLTNSYRN